MKRTALLFLSLFLSLGLAIAIPATVRADDPMIWISSIKLETVKIDWGHWPSEKFTVTVRSHMVTESSEAPVRFFVMIDTSASSDEVASSVITIRRLWDRLYDKHRLGAVWMLNDELQKCESDFRTCLASAQSLSGQADEGDLATALQQMRKEIVSTRTQYQDTIDYFFLVSGRMSYQDEASIAAQQIQAWRVFGSSAGYGGGIRFQRNGDPFLDEQITADGSAARVDADFVSAIGYWFDRIRSGTHYWNWSHPLGREEVSTVGRTMRIVGTGFPAGDGTMSLGTMKYTTYHEVQDPSDRQTFWLYTDYQVKKEITVVVPRGQMLYLPIIAR